LKSEVSRLLDKLGKEEKQGKDHRFPNREQHAIAPVIIQQRTIRLKKGKDEPTKHSIIGGKGRLHHGNHSPGPTHSSWGKV